MILVHLVSEQTLQNLLPTLALRPRAIALVASGDERFAGTGHALQAALTEAGVEVETLPPLQLPERSPTAAAVRRAMEAHFAGLGEVALNLTGGTKLMSIGAYAWALDHRRPALYTDTIGRRLVDLDTAPWQRPLPELSETLRSLTVPIVLRAQGRECVSEEISDALRRFGLQSWRLRRTHSASVAQWTAEVRRWCMNDGDDIPDKKSVLRDLLAKPLPPPGSAEAESFRALAAAAGLVRIEEPERAFLQADASRSQIQRVRNLLDGAWMELAIAAMAEACPDVRDVRWSVDPARRVDVGETDLILLRGERLEVISCKTDLEHVQPLEHLASWRDRALRLGGSHARARLCVFASKSPQQAASLRQRGSILGVEVAFADDIEREFGNAAFDRFGLS